jgi:hypothetical protein
VGEKYFYLDVIKGEVDVDYYTWENDEIDNALYRLHNIFPTKEEAEAAIPCVEDALKVALKGKNGDNVMSREKADSAMRRSIDICAIIDKNTSLLRENKKLKEELESFIIRCEYLQKAKEQSHAAVDGVTLTDGEKALIRAFRNGRLCGQFSGGSSLIVEGHDKVPCGVAVHREFVAFFMHSPMQNGEVRNALEQIKAAQEANQ